MRGTGMMTMPGPDSLGGLDAEVCADDVDAFEAGEGLLDVSSVVWTEVTDAYCVALCAVVDGTVEPGKLA